MNPSNRSRPKTPPLHALPPPEQVSEVFYEHALELTKIAYFAAARSYPMEIRKANPKANYSYEEALAQAKQHLNKHKVIVRDSIIPLAKITVHRLPYHDPEDRHTADFRTLIEQQLKALYLRLKDYAPLLVPEEDVASLLAALDSVYGRESERLSEALSKYEATAVYCEADFN